MLKSQKSKTPHGGVGSFLCNFVDWGLAKYRIAEEEMRGEGRAEYGLSIIKRLSKELTAIYGKGFMKTNLYNYYSFYKNFSEIFHPVSGKSQDLLSWTHYRILLQVADSGARDWYCYV